MSVDIVSTGITFSSTNTPGQSNGTGSSNTLDDYEEGNWTPYWTGSSSDPSTPSSATGSGHYTKFGRQVSICYGLVNRTTTGASGDMRVNNIPFTCNTGLSFGNFMCYNTNFNTDYIITLRVSGTFIEFTESRNTTTWTFLDCSAGSSRYMYGSAVYMTDV